MKTFKSISVVGTMAVLLGSLAGCGQQGVIDTVEVEPTPSVIQGEDTVLVPSEDAVKVDAASPLAVLAASSIGNHTAHAGFYRVGQPLRLVPLCVSDNEDLDGDGVVNHNDVDSDGDLIVNSADTHPCDADSNHDGIIDGFEYNGKNNTVVTITCAAAVVGDDPWQAHNNDLDGDGILNYADDYPCDADVDQNGVPDLNQMPLGLCGPELSDSDGDWLVNRDDNDIDGDGIANPDDDHPCDPDANHKAANDK